MKQKLALKKTTFFAFFRPWFGLIGGWDWGGAESLLSFGDEVGNSSNMVNFDYRNAFL
jgi:hypothetical protein